MPRIIGVELYELDLPFRQPFRHAAAERSRSGTVFARFVTSSGHFGYGETLPRPYVTGEERRATFDLLAERILPRLLELEFASFREVHDFLVECNGKAPPEWVESALPQTAAWCLVDLALLDTFGRAFDLSVNRELAGGDDWPEGLRYSAVLSGGSTRKTLAPPLLARLYGMRNAKVKVDGGALEQVRMARRVLGRRARLRIDANMAWTYEEARTRMQQLAGYGVESFEQPLAADDIDGSSRLVAETGLPVMADESFHDAASLERLITARACTAVNVRIAKCGGLVASIARSKRALEAGLTLQIGCQVGESSQLSAAQMVLIRSVGEGVRYAEGCFGQHLLVADPVGPLLQFGRGGRPPRGPPGPGFGTRVDKEIIQRHAGRWVAVGSPVSTHVQEES
jgi:L-Ala-D/L-Glu epimerase